MCPFAPRKSTVTVNRGGWQQPEYGAGVRRSGSTREARGKLPPTTGVLEVVHFVENLFDHPTECVNVVRRERLAALESIGRDVAPAGSQVRSTERHGETKVIQEHGAVLAKQDVTRLHVGVNVACAMDASQRRRKSAKRRVERRWRSDER